MESDSFENMVEAVRRFHRKHRLKELGGEDMPYRISLMVEELGEISCCVTKGHGKSRLAEEVADLLILILGTGIAQDLDLAKAFWEKMERLERRGSRMIDGRIRVSEFKDTPDG